MAVKDSAPRARGRVLLAQTSFLGDVVLTTALAQALARERSDFEIWWLVRPDAAGLVAPLVGAARVLVFDKRGCDRGPIGLWRAATRLRKIGFDYAVGVQRSVRTAALLALARVPLRIGFARSPGAPFYHRTVEATGAHARDRLLSLLRGFEIASVADRWMPRLQIDAGARSAVEGLLAGAGIGREERIAVLAPGSAWATKQWPAEYFGEVGAELLRQRKDRIDQGDRVGRVGRVGRMDQMDQINRLVVVGGAADFSLAKRIGGSVARVLGEQARSRVVDLTGRTDIGGLVAMIGRASLVVANDSAAAHVAGALDVPVVAVFGPTVPAQGFAPLGARVKIAEHALECRPCSRHGGDRCPIGTHACMRELPPSAVLEALRHVAGGSA